MMQIEVVTTQELGDRSYIAHDGATAVVIDPQRDIDRLEAVLDGIGVRCSLVLETHIHNDYVSGGCRLARSTGADYAVSAREAVDFERHPVDDGDRLSAGTLEVRVVATPGHTDHHLSFLVSADAGAPAVFTGGSLLYGSVGRTDLVGAEHTRRLTHAQYHSVRALAALTPDDTRVYPTHGFGSFCSAGAVSGETSSTIGTERRVNEALTELDENRFTDRLLAGLSAYPAYYAHMDARNRTCAAPVDLSPPEPVTPERLRQRIAAGEWVVDVRDRTTYATDHLIGTIGIALENSFATWLGWLIPWGTPLTLIGDSRAQVADAQRQLVRIGIDRPAGQAIGRPADLATADARRGYPVVSYVELSGDRPDEGAVLDVRRDDERSSGHIPGSRHIPLHELPDRLGELPRTRLWVHCSSGYRASIAASLLDRAGHDVVCVDDDYEHAENLGLTTFRAGA